MLLFPHSNAFRLKMQFIRQDDNLFFYSMFSFKKQFKLEINQTRDKNTLPSNMAPWHLGHHQRQRATCTFPPIFCQGNRSQNLEKNFMTFFLKQIGRLHLRDSCLSSKKRIRGPEMSSIDPLLFTPKQKTT